MGEVASQATMGHLFKFYTLFAGGDPGKPVERKYTGGPLDDGTGRDRRQSRVSVWLHMAMEAPDQ